MQHASAPVIAQAAPRSQHRGFSSRCKVLDGRKAEQEFAIVLGYCSHTSLLQHDFREPDAIGIAIFSPRQVTPAALVPVEKPASKCGMQLGWIHLVRALYVHLISASMHSAGRYSTGRICLYIHLRSIQSCNLIQPHCIESQNRPRAQVRIS